MCYSWWNITNLPIFTSKSLSLKTDKVLLVKGLKRLAITVMLMFTGPVVLYQAFKNQDHPFYIPVLVIGALIALGAIVMGFLGIKTLVDALFGKKPQNTP